MFNISLAYAKYQSKGTIDVIVTRTRMVNYISTVTPIVTTPGVNTHTSVSVIRVRHFSKSHGRSRVTEEFISLSNPSVKTSKDTRQCSRHRLNMFSA